MYELQASFIHCLIGIFDHPQKQRTHDPIRTVFLCLKVSQPQRTKHPSSAHVLEDPLIAKLHEESQ